MKAQIPENFYFKYEVVVEAFNRLIKLMENDAETIKSEAVENLQTNIDARTDLINFLILQQQNMVQNPQIKEQLNSEQKRTLLELSKRLQQVTESSQYELQKAMVINEKLLTFFKNAVKTARNKSVGYSSIGKMRSSSAFVEIPAVALNETL